MLRVLRHFGIGSGLLWSQWSENDPFSIMVSALEFLDLVGYAHLPFSVVMHSDNNFANRLSTRGKAASRKREWGFLAISIMSKEKVGGRGNWTDAQMIQPAAHKTCISTFPWSAQGIYHLIHCGLICFASFCRRASVFIFSTDDASLISQIITLPERRNSTIYARLSLLYL